MPLAEDQQVIAGRSSLGAWWSTGTRAPAQTPGYNPASSQQPVPQHVQAGLRRGEHVQRVGHLQLPGRGQVAGSARAQCMQVSLVPRASVIRLFAASAWPSMCRSPLGRRPYDLRHAAVSLWLNFARHYRDDARSILEPRQRSNSGRRRAVDRCIPVRPPRQAEHDRRS